MGDFLGIRAWRQKPLGERLWPWWVYAAIACVNLALLPFALTGWGFEYPSRASVIGLLFLLPGSLVMAGLAVVARRHR